MSRFLRRLDWPLFLSMAALVAIGVVFIRSAGSARTVHTLQIAWRSHVWTAAAGLGAYFLLAALDYRKILDFLSWPFYALALAMLVAVRFAGSTIYGGRRWLWFFQPSEVAKLAVILLAAQVFGRPGRESFRWAAAGLAIAGVPAVLIMMQPDLGTALVLVPTIVVMLFAARVWRTGIAALCLAALILAGGALGAVWTAERGGPQRREAIYSALPLQNHQIKRLRVFLDPETDRYGGGWNLRQAKLSIGSGALTGKGIGKGEQKFLGYLPPSVSMNDFIFAVLAEEAGFAGSVCVLGAFLVLLLSGLGVAYRSDDDRGRLIAAGMATLVFCHVYVNVAMSVGLMPITGLPLPFISAGRTFLVILMAGLGIVQSVAVHKGDPQ